MKPFDPKCYDLANKFLQTKGATEDEIVQLAAEIQETIEAFLEWREAASKAIAGEGDKK